MTEENSNSDGRPPPPTKEDFLKLSYLPEKGDVIVIVQKSPEEKLLMLAATSLIQKRKENFLGGLFVKKAIQKNEISKILTHKEKLILDSIARNIRDKRNTELNKLEDEIKSISKDNIDTLQKTMDSIVDNKKEEEKSLKPSMFKKIREALQNYSSKARQNSTSSVRSISKNNDRKVSNRSKSSKSIFD